MNDLTKSHDLVTNEALVFASKYFSNNDINEWVHSKGIPAQVEDAFLSSNLGKYCRPIEYGGIDCDLKDRVTLIKVLTYKAGATLPFLSDILSMTLASSLFEMSKSNISRGFISSKGTISFSEAFTEANAGVTASQVQTSITMHGSTPILNGVKTFVSGGQFQPHILVLAKDPFFGDNDRSQSLWLIPSNLKGVETLPLNTIGQEMLAPAILEFHNVRLDPEWRIETNGNLNSILNKQYQIGRLLICSSSLGLGIAAFHDSFLYSKKHRVHGRRLIDIPQIEEKLSDMITDLQSCEHFIYKTADTLQYDSNNSALECAMMKRFVPRACTRVASYALQIFGGRGYTSSERVGRIWRDCRGNQIAQGTDEIMSHTIAKELDDLDFTNNVL